MRRLLIFFLFTGIVFFFIKKNESFIKLSQSLLSNLTIENIRLKKINIINLKYIDEKIILDLLNLRLGDNFLNIKLKNIEKKLKSINEIKSFKIEKNINGIINIEITEKIPFVVWEKENKNLIIDKEGQVLNFLNFPSERLIKIKGKKANKEIEKIYNKISIHTDLKNNLISAKYIENYRWDILLKDDLYVKLPFNNVESSLELLDKLIKKEKFLKSNYKIIDMRVDGRLFLK